MKKYNPYRNIYYYYRGPSHKNKEGYDKQIEDNTTKALFNTLEFGHKDLLLSFFEELGIEQKSLSKTLFDLQVTEKLSRSDALIQIGDHSIYIESKIDSPLELDQIKRHLKAVDKGYLVCITPRSDDEIKLRRIKDSRLKFITWEKIYSCFDQLITTDIKTTFLITQFLEYLEAINMAPFNGWNKKDFEAFLNIEEDTDREMRLRVKEKLWKFVKALTSQLHQRGLYNELVPDVGNIKTNDKAVFAVLCRPPVSNKVQVSHFNFWMDSDAFHLGVQIEGKRAADRMRNQIKSKSGGFYDIINELDGFSLSIKKRINLSGRPRDYYGFEVANLKLGSDITLLDADYIVKKIDQYRLIEFNCGLHFKRDDEKISKDTFLDISIDAMEKLEGFYKFSLG